MNVSPSAHAASPAPGAPGKHGKSENPLADFMALLGQLGITVETDGTLTTTPTTPAGAEDVTAKILARLGRKVTDKPSAEMVKLPIEPEGEESDDGSAATDSDPAAKLAALLAGLDQSAVEPGKVPEKIDIAGLLSAVRAIAAGEIRPAIESATPSAEASPVVQAVSRPAAASIASLLARTTRDGKTGDDAPPPGTVQATFVRLEKLVAGKTANAQPETEAGATAPAANDDTAADAAKPEQQGATKAKETELQVTDSDKPGTVGAKLSELLARLTASAKPGAPQVQPQQQRPQTAHANAVRPVADPQLAALAQAIQQAGGNEHTRDDAGDQVTANQGALGATLGIGGTPVAAAPSGEVRTDALPDTMHHHLDLARDSEWLDTLARDITRAAQNDAHLRFNLNPEHLGSLKVELLNGANGTSVKLTADTEAARAILVDAQPRLVAEARAQGLRISETHVDLSGQGGGQRHMAEAPVLVRTGNAAAIAEIEQDMPAGSGERYA